MAELDEGIGWDTSESFEVLGRVVNVLCTTPGPLGECLGFHTWPVMGGNGYVLAWHGPRPSDREVLDYLLDAAADDDMTRTLRPGDVRWRRAGHCLIAEVRGVQFQLRPEPIVRSDTLVALERYWSGPAPVVGG